MKHIKRTRGCIMWALVLALGIHAFVLFGWSLKHFEAPLADSMSGDTMSEVDLVAFAPSPEIETNLPTSEAPEPKSLPDSEPILAPEPESLPEPLEDVMPEPVPVIQEPKQNLSAPPKASQPIAAKVPTSNAKPPSPKAKLTKAGSATSSTNTSSQGTVSGRSGKQAEGSRPTYLRNPHPTYPSEARKAGWEGVVTLRVSVGKTGRVQAACVECSCGHQALDQRALETVRDRWVFRPAKVNGQSVDAEVLVPIRFSLK